MQPNQARVIDQATGLRQVTGTAPIRTIAVSAGKGGVGKTNVSVNLAITLAKQGQKVLLLDADLGLANIDVLLGLHPRQNLAHVFDGQCELDEVLLEGPEGIKIIPASSGVEKMTQLLPQDHAGLINAFSQLTEHFDVLIIDTAAGISDSVVSFTKAAQEILLVVCDEPTSITDAYAMIKILSREHQVNNFHILANMVRSASEGRQLFQKLYRVTEHFLDVTMDYVGAIQEDDLLKKSVKQQQAVVKAYPSSKSARAFEKLAQQVLLWKPKPDLLGQTSFFIERLIRN